MPESVQDGKIACENALMDRRREDKPAPERWKESKGEEMIQNTHLFWCHGRVRPPVERPHSVLLLM